MKFILLIIALAVAKCESVTAMLKPVSLTNSNSIFGKGSDLGEWSVQVCSESNTSLIVPRARLMMAFPTLRDIPNKQAADLLARKAAKDPRSIIGNNGDTALGLVSSGTAVGGLIAKSPATAYVGLGMSVLQLVFRSVKSNAPNPAPYISDLLPDQLPLTPFACDDSHIIVASLMHGAAPMGPVTVQIPKP